MASNEPFLLKDNTRRKTLSVEEAEAEWSNLGYRDRFRTYFKEAAGANYTLPVFLVVFVTIILGLIWFAVFYFLIAKDASQEFFSEFNIRRFVLYNVLHGVLGFGAASGPLGIKTKVLLGQCLLMFSTPGTLCSPLLPGVVGLVQKTPAKRSIVNVLLYFAYISALVYAIIDPSFTRVIIVNSVLAVATVFDFTIFLASRGEHYGYMMIAMCFPDWIAGCQWVQLMMWLMVGVSKCGPWFKYVVQVLVANAIWTPFLPKHFQAKLFFKDYDNDDFAPSMFAHGMAMLGALGEWGFPLCAVLGPLGGAVNFIGVFGMISYHCLIWCTLPTASVFEWQYFTIVMTYFLYRVPPTGLLDGQAIHLPTSPLLIVFLVFVLLFLPIVGQLKPTLVPFLLAYRQYAGNWRMGSVLLRKSAKEKFKKLKTYEPIDWWNYADPAMGGDKADFKIMASFMVVPQFRGQFSIMEAFFEKTQTTIDDFEVAMTFTFINAVNGWNLGGGWEINRECWRKAFVEVCDLAPGDAYLFMAEPVEPLPPYNLQFRVMDMTKGPTDAEIFANVPYAELEGTHPMKVDIKPERIQSGNSIKGMFLDTYYI